MTRPTRAVVDLDAIAANYRLLEEAAGGAGRVLPVVKADAYGHGALPVARRLAREGARRFAVALQEEGEELR
ncbi:MAG: alanine racemase, partial [Acidobacteriota bacterium]|nr:alanine racemase [Acidobacteriota bacterium]